MAGSGSLAVPGLRELPAPVGPECGVEAHLRGPRQELRREHLAEELSQRLAPAFEPVPPAGRRDGRAEPRRENGVGDRSAGVAGQELEAAGADLKPAASPEPLDAAPEARGLGGRVGAPRAGQLAERLTGEPREGRREAPCEDPRRTARGEASNATRAASRGRGAWRRVSTSVARAQRERPKTSSPPMPVSSEPPRAASRSGTWKWALKGQRMPCRRSTPVAIGPTTSSSSV